MFKAFFYNYFSILGERAFFNIIFTLLYTSCIGFATHVLWNDKKLKFFIFFTKIYQSNTWPPKYVLRTIFLRRLLLRMKMGLISWGSVKIVFLRNFCSCHFWMKRNLGWLEDPGENFMSFCIAWADRQTCRQTTSCNLATPLTIASLWKWDLFNNNNNNKKN